VGTQQSEGREAGEKWEVPVEPQGSRVVLGRRDSRGGEEVKCNVV